MLIRVLFVLLFTLFFTFFSPSTEPVKRHMNLTSPQKKTLFTLMFIGSISSLDKSMMGLTVMAVGEEFSLLQVKQVLS